MSHHSLRQAGVSLVEALVAMAVMAFGMLALLGLQTTLRANSDMSKQRAEAVRFGQEFMESKRAYSVLEVDAADPLKTAYASIADQAEGQVALSGYSSSAQFMLGMQARELPLPDSTSLTDRYYLAPSKQMAVSVRWTDTNGEDQKVVLRSIVSRTAAEVVGALAVTGSGSMAQLNRGRNPVIPPGSLNLQDDPGKSIFSPLGTAGGVYWKFDNVTGFITESCLTITVVSPSTVVAENCTAFNRRLLTGYLRFALTDSAPTSATSETPPDNSSALTGVEFNVVVHVDGYLDTATARPELCYSREVQGYWAYYCAVPVTDGNVWSGRATVTFNHCWSRTVRRYNTDVNSPTYLSDLESPYRCTPQDAERFATDSTLNDNNTSLVSTADSSLSRYRICRYTARRDQSLVTYPDSSTNPPPQPWIKNIEHPRDYASVAQSLNNQNFLIIRAGNGQLPFECPDDDPQTLPAGRTWYHQPSS